MRIVLGSDHAGFAVRKRLAEALAQKGHLAEELGAVDEQSYDYPHASDGVVRKVLDGEADMGILICGTGIGVSIRANRHPGIRAAVCCSPAMAQLARQHNHANVLCLGARMLNPEEVEPIVEAFLQEPQSGEPRHLHRVELLDADVDRKNGVGRV